MNLDCLLISPPIYYKNSQSIWEEVNSNFPPLGLASIAAYLQSKGYSVKIVDCNVEAPSLELFDEYFGENFSKKYETIRWVGITAMTPHIKKAYEIAKIVKETYPLTKTVVGGVHATFLTEEVLKNPLIDFVVKGEGEITLGELISGVNPSEIKGLAYINGENMIINPPRERITNLDDFPMPAYDLLPIRKYRPAKGTYRKLPAMSMITSRGCPGKCTFCNKTLGNRIVFKDAQTIFNEIQYLHKNYGIQQILFYDDTFTVFKRNVLKLCKLLIQSKMDIAWTCFARVDYVGPVLLKWMRAAGCHQIMYGVENVNETVLRNIKKKIDKEKVIKAVKWTKDAGIECRLAFMVGNPGDTPLIIEENIRFIKEINPDLIIVNITTPFPGTEMFEWAKERDLLLTYDWDKFNLSEPVMRLENMSEIEIKKLYKLMYRKFYFRPSYFLRKILSIRRVEDFNILLEGFRALLKFFGI